MPGPNVWHENVALWTLKISLRRLYSSRLLLLIESFAVCVFFVGPLVCFFWCFSGQQGFREGSRILLVFFFWAFRLGVVLFGWGFASFWESLGVWEVCWVCVSALVFD